MDETSEKNLEYATAIAAESTRRADGISPSHTQCVYSLGKPIGERQDPV